jgi:multidrug efflux pump subunit AcrA (membrane-fusion protein)
VVLPRNILRLDGTILTVDDDKKIKINFVTVQRSDENFVYISDGLNPLEQVVMSAIPNPYEGMPVRFSDDEVTPKIQAESTVDDNAIEVK